VGEKEDNFDLINGGLKGELSAGGVIGRTLLNSS
jgi:hypothetical protein